MQFKNTLLIVAVALGLTACGGSSSGSSNNTPTAVVEDATPDDFNFISKENTPINTWVESEEIVISGINVEVPILVESGQYSIDGSNFKTGEGFIKNGQKVVVRTKSANTRLTESSSILRIGDLEAKFTVKTEARLFFLGVDSLKGNELRTTNLAAGNTVLVADFNTTPVDTVVGTGAKAITEIDGSIYFCRGETNLEFSDAIFKFDESSPEPSNILTLDNQSLVEKHSCHKFFSLNETIYLVTVGVDNENYLWELKKNGSEYGFNFVRNFPPLTENTYYESNSVHISRYIAADMLVEVYYSDMGYGGPITSDSYVRIQPLLSESDEWTTLYDMEAHLEVIFDEDLQYYCNSDECRARYIGFIDGFIYFSGAAGVWRTDGTKENTVKVYKAHDYSALHSGFEVSHISEEGFIYHWQGVGRVSFDGREVLKLPRNTNENGAYPSTYGMACDTNDYIFYVAKYQSVGNDHVYAYDKASKQVSVVFESELRPLNGSTALFCNKDYALINVPYEGDGIVLSSFGTPNTTQILKENLHYFRGAYQVDNLFYFAFNDDSQLGLEFSALWRTDGLKENTEQVHANILAEGKYAQFDVSSGVDDNVSVINRSFYYNGYNEPDNVELWRGTATTEPTRLTLDSFTNPETPANEGVTAENIYLLSNSRLLFEHFDQLYSYALAGYSSDYQPEVVNLGDSPCGIYGSSDKYLYYCDYFNLGTGWEDNEYSLYRTDGVSRQRIDDARPNYQEHYFSVLDNTALHIYYDRLKILFDDKQAVTIYKTELAQSSATIFGTSSSYYYVLNQSEEPSSSLQYLYSINKEGMYQSVYNAPSYEELSFIASSSDRIFFMHTSDHESAVWYIEEESGDAKKFFNIDNSVLASDINIYELGNRTYVSISSANNLAGLYLYEAEDASIRRISESIRVTNLVHQGSEQAFVISYKGLWQLTSGSLTLIADKASLNINEFSLSQSGNEFVLDGKLIFEANGNAWISDGTLSGTYALNSELLLKGQIVPLQ